MINYEGLEIGGYQILEQIGAGGMAKVFKAYQPTMDRMVALKLLPDLYAQDPSYIERFTQEARIIGNLEHKHILPVFDFGEQSGIAFLAMRYLQGGTLKDLLALMQEKRLGLADTFHLTRQIGSALDYAHQRGIIHRDVKPSNILIDTQGDVFLTDFGIAKILEATSFLTSTGGTLGTPAYMAPEQAAGKSVDARSDLYSLGIVLYHMLTGAPPFDADTPYATILAQINEPLPLPRTINHDIPAEVEQILLKTLAKDPEARFQTAGELIEAYSAALENQGKTIANLNVSTQMAQISQDLASSKSSEDVTHDDYSALQHTRRARAFRKALPWLAGIIATLLISIAGFAILRSNANLDQAQSTAFALVNARDTTEALASATLDAGEIAAAVSGLTATARYNQNTIATQAAQLRNGSATVLALTPSSTPTITTTPSPIDLGRHLDYCGADLCIFQSLTGNERLGLSDKYTRQLGFGWSPDSNQIVFDACPLESPGDNCNGIYILDTLTESIELLYSTNFSEDNFPTWSPDGDWIALGSNGDLSIIQPNGTLFRKLVIHNNATCNNEIAWSPDSQFLAFVGGNCTPGEWLFSNIWIITREGTNLRLVYEGETNIRHIAWSPDAKTLAFELEGGASYLIDSDCNGRQEECTLLQLESIKEIPIHWHHTFSPQWAGEILEN